MDYKIAFLTPEHDLEEKLSSMFPAEIESGQFTVKVVDVGDINAFSEQAAFSIGSQVEKAGYELVITRGGVFAGLDTKLQIPVFRMEVTTVDIIRAIYQASELKREIVLMLWNKIYFDIDTWRKLFSVPITVEYFHDYEEIRRIVQDYASRRNEIVLVSGGIGRIFARHYGIEHRLLVCSKELIYETINHAVSMLKRYREEKYHSNLLQTILASAHDAAVVVDQQGDVILFSKNAEKLLNTRADRILGKPLRKSFPELDRLMGSVSKGKANLTSIQQINGVTIAANISKLESEGCQYGTLCMFEDVSKLQKMEKKIRYELNKKGHIARYTLDGLVTRSANMKKVVERARIAAQSSHTVMLLGESGTGKEMLAQGIHNASSRKSFPFVAVNCAALSESLLESELFGYEEGAFTGARKGGKQGLFELAHGGTIFLDEINSISQSLQSKLLRVLEEREIMHIGSDYVISLDVRIIVAANEDLQGLVDCGVFRKDLYYRLNTLELRIPPLRQRPDDILPLFQMYLEQESKGNVPELLPDQSQRLVNYTWPGNVRELRNVVHRYLMFGTLDLNADEQMTTSLQGGRELISLKDVNQYVEEKIIQMFLASGLTKTQIADILGISRSALWKRINTKPNLTEKE